MAQINTKLDTLFHINEEEKAPGVAVAIVKDGQTIHCKGYGLANLEWKQPITPQTIFALGSNTKPFTSTAILLLEQQGKLHLNDSIQTYLPDYPTHGRHVTLLHLLTHTSGIPNFVTQPGFWKECAHVEDSVDEVIAFFKDLPFDFEPGTRYSYSNSGYVLLGRILESLLESSYAEVIQHLIFDPLGMTHSYYLRQESVLPLRASGYTSTASGYQHAPLIASAAKYAAGGLGSTLEDMLLWNAALRDERLLDHETQERMYRPVELTDGRTENYGLGWVIGHYHQHHYLCHTGGIPGFSTFFARFPDDNTTIILLSNKGGFECARIASEIQNLLLEPSPPVHTSVTLTPEKLSQAIGTYRSVHGTVEVSQNELALSLHWTRTHTLVPMSETRFHYADDEDIEVHFENQNEQGIYKRLRVVQPFFWFTAERAS